MRWTAQITFGIEEPILPKDEEIIRVVLGVFAKLLMDGITARGRHGQVYVMRDARGSQPRARGNLKILESLRG